jgi:hypothetical protein
MWISNELISTQRTTCKMQQLAAPCKTSQVDTVLTLGTPGVSALSARPSSGPPRSRCPTGAAFSNVGTRPPRLPGPLRPRRLRSVVAFGVSVARCAADNSPKDRPSAHHRPRLLSLFPSSHRAHTALDDSPMQLLARLSSCTAHVPLPSASASASAPASPMRLSLRSTEFNVRLAAMPSASSSAPGGGDKRLLREVSDGATETRCSHPPRPVVRVPFFACLPRPPTVVRHPVA